jgi:hypothetical protein
MPPTNVELSFGARLVVALSVVVATGGPFAWFWFLYDRLPAGRYPLFLFAVPVFVLAGVIAGIGFLVLRLLGQPLFAPRRDEDDR